ncbi:PREDICTED: low-density lipoprotein receptor-related protein 6-like [Acropora digitifera]|uniref:low-density lipoprotein receptor-related protein 6-like n=1 Tax=Acropora digitifera TaxID=70779 RepID=UPI00077A4BA7|nr:PREDICTED: low-density lipoprotein receptor-related protein 6-like [Acropora digitifera]
MELDKGNKRIYWVDGGTDRIESVNYQGNNRILLSKVTGFHAFGVAMISPFLFFTDWASGGVLHKLDADTGNHIVSNYNTRGWLMGIVAYDQSTQPPVSNQCNINNGGCSHFCVVTSSSPLCVCPTGFALKQDGRTCENKIKKFFLFTDADDKSTNIISLDVNYFAAKRLFSHHGQRPIALDFDPVKDRVYWTDVEQGLILGAFSNGTALKILFRCNVNIPDGIAIDKVARNIYWSDRGTNRIEVARLDGTKRKLLIKDGLDEPRAIVLDERNGTMYWTDWGSNPKIEQAAMDGSSRRIVITGNLGWPNGLTIDRSANRLYWADAKLDKIEVSDLTGANRRLVMSSAADIHPFGLTLYQGMLYWTEWNNQGISRLDLSNGNKKMIITGLKKPMDIHLYDSSVTISGSHPCATNRGLCSDLCLLKPHGGYQCACPTGIFLKPDGRTCDYVMYNNKSSDHFMLFAEANAGEIYKVPLDVTDTPCERLAIRDNISRPVAVDYDPVEGKVYWTDVTLKQIVRSYPNGSHLEVLATHNVINPDGIAIDWIGRNIYWTDAGTNRIDVSRLDGSFRTSLITANLDLPRAIILDIESRKMYWSDWGYSPKIEKSNMDGTGRRTIVSFRLTWVNSLALDFKNKLLYWCDAWLDLIERVDLQGNNRVVVLNLPSDKYHHPFGLALYQDALFWTDWRTQSVHKYNMTSSTSEVFLHGMRRPMGIHMYDYNTITTGMCVTLT